MCCVKRFRLGHKPETCIPIAIMHLLLFSIYRPMVLVLKNIGQVLIGQMNHN